MNSFKVPAARSRMSRTPLQNILLGGASALAIAILVGPAIAQDASQPVETVVVTGRREALENAQKIKENADQIVDAVVADDAGKLPDNSVTEVLSRVPGVTIGRFAAVGDPDHYSIEGSGVAVRGLTQVSSLLNGRASFSANGGRALLWEDVPPELMAAVSVYKSSTADQLEGGIGGSVDLRTHMPFDYDKMEFNGSIGENYGDYVKQGRPSGSALFTNRWDTKVGEIGFLVDVAYSDISSRYDTMQLEPYWQETLYTNPDGSANPAGVNAFVPGGFDFRTGGYDRKRTGVYEAVQWKPTDRLTIYQTGFESYYDQFQQGVAMYLANGNAETPAPGTKYTLDSRGGLTQADSIIYTGWQPLACPTGTTNCAWAGGDTGYSKGGNRTSDLTEGFQWDATDRLYVAGAFQYTHSTSNTNNNDVFPETAVPSFSITTNGNGLPVVTVPNAASLTDPSLYIWEAAMDHLARHSGSQIAGNLDAKFDVSDSGFIRTVKFGVRYANMTEKDQDAGYSWNGITPPWASPLHYMNQPQNNGRPSQYYLETFKDFFRGKAALPFEQIEPTLAMVEEGTSFIHQQYGDPGDTTGPVQYYPYEAIASNTKTKDAYLMAEFAANSVFGMMMNGNIGLRVVNNENTSTGSSFQYPWTNAKSTISGPYCGATPDPITHLYNCSSPTNAGDPNNGVVATPSTGGRHYTKVLPSFNIQFLPTDSIHLRFAASQTLSNPSFTQLAAGGNVSFQNCGGAGVFEANCTANAPYTGYVGAPDLKPQISTNLDLSAEWYGANQSAVHVAVFYKSIADYLEYGSFEVPTTVAEPNGNVTVANVLINNYYNTAKAATIKGMEIGGTKFFDFLPAPFDGLGVDANFTYIDSASPGDMSCQLFSAKAPAVNGPCGGEAITGLPIEQLSKYNYNLTGMYEKGDWSVRVAYNWRSKYLLVASGANGTKTLPVFSLPYGQLDFGASYKLSENVTFGVDGQNLLDSVAKTVDGYNSPQYGNQQYNRNWYVSDRRFIASVKFAF